MKKTLLFLSSLLLAAGVSCSAKNSEKSEPITPYEPKFSDSGLPVVTVGTTGYIDPLFNDSLNKPTDMEINIVEFKTQEGASTATVSDFYNSLLLTIEKSFLTGDAPDIILCPPEIMGRLVRQGTMADLYGIMEEYDGYKKDDFTECALEGLTVDGELPALVERYYIETAVARTSNLGKDLTNWTAEQAMAAFNDLPEDMAFCECESETSLADFMFKAEGISRIDLKDNTCDLGGTFTELLSFCKANPVSVTTFDTSRLSPEERQLYELDREAVSNCSSYLVYPVYIGAFDNNYAQQTFGYFGGEDVTFVGYPSEDGQGAVVGTTVYPMFGITKQCGNKEAAWDLICRMIMHNKDVRGNTITDGIPTLKSRLEDAYNDTSDGTSSINRTIYMEYFGGENVTITQEYKDMLYDYLLSVPVDLYKPASLRYIFDEEIAPVITDNRTPEQGAEIIRNRIETYLSERS